MSNNKRTFLGLLTLILITFIAVGCGESGTKNTGSSPKSITESSSNTPQPTTYIDADINAMLTEAESNGAAANKHYKGKKLKILGGHIQNIDSGLSYISIDGNAASFSLIHVNCKIDANNQELQDSVIQLKKGENVVVYGTITEVGDIMGYTMELDKIETANYNMSDASPTPVTHTSTKNSSATTTTIKTVSHPVSNATLGNVKLGYSLAEAESSLGSPSKKTVKEEGKLRYEYPLMDVAYDYGAVVGMAADDASVTTPKGIHAGSPLQEVLNKYGSDYMLSTYDNLDLYEYKYTDDNQRPYLLRFAVRQGDGNVKYISIRYID